VKFGILIRIALKPKNSKTGNFCPGADPGAPDAERNIVYSTSRYYRSVKFGILIRIAVNLNGKIQNPKNSVQGQIQGPLTPGEIWSKALPGIVEA